MRISARAKRSSSLVVAFLLVMGFTSIARAQGDQPQRPKEEEPRTAGDWVWMGRIAPGILVATGPGSDTVDFGLGSAIALEVVRGLTCHVEVFGGTMLPFRQQVSISDVAGHIAPTGFQTGFTFKTCQRLSGDLYTGVIVGGFVGDGTQRLTVNGTPVVYSFAGGVGGGFTAGYRRITGQRLAYDFGIRWQRLRVRRVDRAPEIWNPLWISVGLLVRF